MTNRTMAAATSRPARLTVAASMMLVLSLVGPAAYARDVPDGTLKYTITITGQGDLPKSGPYDEHVIAHINHRLEASWRMRGHASASIPDAPVTGSVMAELEQGAEACGDDDACMMALSQRVMKRKAELSRESKVFIAAAERGRVWEPDEQTPCRIQADVNDTSVHVGMYVGEGNSTPYTTHRATKGTRVIDCRASMPDDLPKLLVTDGNLETYALTLPSMELQVTESDDSGQPSHVRTEVIKGFQEDKLPLARIDGPQGGHRIFHKTIGSSTNTAHGGHPVELKIDLNWSFNPDSVAR